MGADEAFAIGLAALGSSVVSHCRGRPLVLYIVDAGISAGTRERLRASWPSDDTTVHWLRLDAGLLERAGIIDQPPSRRPATVPLLLDLLLPDEVERALYLDADALVLSDLTPLWDVDLGGYATAAVQDTMIPYVQNESYVPEEIDTSRPLPYFNSGVLLVDMHRWRQENFFERARDFLRRHHHRVWSADQQVLNWTVAGRWQRMPLSWNRMSHILDIPSWRCTCFEQGEFEEAVQNPRIAHFAGPSKPWQRGCRDDRLRDFVNQMQKTAWAPWTPPRRGVTDAIADSLWREPHFRYRFVRRGLRVAERGGLPKGPWYRSAAGIALRSPWSVLTFPAVALAGRVRRASP
jgi:lipopolysaccharide biosynthesis glycosyltransferase